MISNLARTSCDDILMCCSKHRNLFMDESIPNLYLIWFENVIWKKNKNLWFSKFTFLPHLQCFHYKKEKKVTFLRFFICRFLHFFEKKSYFSEMISNLIHTSCDDIPICCSKHRNLFMDESIPNLYLIWFENVIWKKKKIIVIFEIYSSQVGRIRPLRPPAGFLPFKYDRPNHEVYPVSFSSSYLFYSRNGSMLLWPLKLYAVMGFDCQASELLFKPYFGIKFW